MNVDPFSSKTRQLKKFANQDYNELKKRCKSKRVLFEDPEFPPSNRLLADDNLFVSYFGRTKLDASTIDWIRPHVSTFLTFLNVILFSILFQIQRGSSHMIFSRSVFSFIPILFYYIPYTIF